jgi:hypothetical protein
MYLHGVTQEDTPPVVLHAWVGLHGTLDAQDPYHPAQQHSLQERKHDRQTHQGPERVKA